MLFTQKSEIDIHEMSPLALAYVGDAVLELLVRARLVIRRRRFHRISGVLQIHKVYAFYHPACMDVETGNNSSSQHITSPISAPL